MAKFKEPDCLPMQPGAIGDAALAGLVLAGAESNGIAVAARAYWGVLHC